MEDFVTYELAVKLKEKGFKEECLCHYIGEDLVYNIESPIANNQLWFSHNKFDNIWHRDNIDAPTISQVLKWLRSQEISVEPLSTPYNDWKCYIKNKGEIVTMISGDKYKTYEQAAIVGIEEVLDNLI